MSAFIACSSCERYIKSSETSCPFCTAALAPAASRRTTSGQTGSKEAPTPAASKQPGSKRPSRAAVFAMRTALLASAASAAVACGGLGTEEREGNDASTVNGKGGATASNATAQAGAPAQGAAAQGGAAPDAVAQAGSAANPASATAGTATGDGTGGGVIEVSDAGAEPEREDDFAPVAIYGGVFPDPMSRAHV